MARRAVGLSAYRAVSRAQFGRGNMFRIVAARASGDLNTVAVGPGQGSAAAVLPPAASGTGGCKRHEHAFRCRASREHSGRTSRLPGRGWAQALGQQTRRRHGAPQQHRAVLRDTQACTQGHVLQGQPEALAALSQWVCGQAQRPPVRNACAEAGHGRRRGWRSSVRGRFSEFAPFRCVFGSSTGTPRVISPGTRSVDCVWLHRCRRQLAPRQVAEPKLAEP